MSCGDFFINNNGVGMIFFGKPTPVSGKSWHFQKFFTLIQKASYSRTCDIPLYVVYNRLEYA